MTNSYLTNISLMTTLANRLNKAMELAGKMPADLVRVTGAKSSSVHNWLNGKTKNLKGKNLVAVAQYLGVSEPWLADGVGSMQRKQVSWPFRRIDETKVRALSYEDLIAIETAFIIEVRKSFGINLSKEQELEKTG